MNENVLVERLEFKLGYEDFISGLRKITNEYHDVVTRISNLGGGVGKSFSQLSKSVNDVVITLGKNTESAIRNNFKVVQSNFATTHDNVRKLGSQIQSDLNTIDQLIKKRGQLLKEQAYAKETLRIAKEDFITKGGDLSPDAAQKTKVFTTIEDMAKKTTEEIGKLDARISVLQSKLYSNVSKLGADTAESFKVTANSVASSLLGISKESEKSLKTVFTTTGDLRKDIGSVVSGKEEIDKILKQRKLLGDQLNTIEQNRIKSQQSLDLARLALLKQNDASEATLYASRVAKLDKINKSIESLEIAHNEKIRKTVERQAQIPLEEVKLKKPKKKDVEDLKEYENKVKLLAKEKAANEKFLAKEKADYEEKMAKLTSSRIKQEEKVSEAYYVMEKSRSSSLYKEAFDNYRKAQQQLNEYLREQRVAIEAHDKIGNALAHAYSKLQPALDSVKQRATGVWNSILQSSKVSYDDYQSNFNRMISDTVKFGSLGPEQVAKYYNSFAKNKEMLVQNVKEIDSMIDALMRLRKIDPGVNVLISNFSTLKKNIQEQLKSLSSIKSSSLGGFEGIVTPVTDAFSGFQKIFSEMTRDVAAFGTLSKDDIVKYFSQFTISKQRIKENIEQLDALIAELKTFKNLDPGVTKLIQHFTNLRNSLKEQAKLMDESTKSAEKLNFSGPLAKSQEKIEQFHQKITELFARINKEKQLFKAQDFASPLGIQQGLQHWRQVVSISEQVRTQFINMRKEISNAERMQSAYEVEIVKTTNKQKQEEYRAYVEQIKVYINELRARLGAYSEQFTMGRNLRDTLVKNATAFKQSIKEQTADWATAFNNLNLMREKYEETRKYASRWGAENREAAQKGSKDVHEYGRAFTEARQRIQDAINSLKRLQSEKSLGFDATKLINSLGEMKKAFDSYSKEVGLMMAGSTKAVDAQARQASKAWYTLVWESLRNLRWQIAGMLYLTTQAVQGVRSILLGTFKEIDDYRKQTYALTATIGMNIDAETFKSQFNEIFLYSRNLMNQLQAESGKTYASFEDLVMVTRSFAQAGIFPRTDEDIAKIGTLATAVKVMTEGMANAGVQMRQEIMALIEGRSRVTDTLARMLKMHGIDIQKAMREWEVIGKDRLTGFSELFSSFAEINKHIAGEYSVQIRRLEVTWGWIKRVAAESLTLQVAKDVDKLVSAMGDLSKGTLTDFGKELVGNVRTGLTFIYETLKSVGSVLLEIYNTFMRLFSTIGRLMEVTDEGYAGLSRWGKEISDFLKALYTVEYILRRVVLAFEYIASAIAGAALDFRAMYLFFSGDTKGYKKAWLERQRVMAEVKEKIALIEVEYQEVLAGTSKKAKELETSLKGLDNQTKKNIDNALDYGGAITNANKALIELDEIGKKYKPKEEKASDDLKKVKDIVEGQMASLTKELEQLSKTSGDQTEKIIEDARVKFEKQYDKSAENVQKIYALASENVKKTIDESNKKAELSTDNMGNYLINVWDRVVNYFRGNPLPIGTEFRGDKVSGTIASILSPDARSQLERQEQEKQNVIIESTTRSLRVQDYKRRKSENEIAQLQKDIAKKREEIEKNIADKLAGKSKKTAIDMWDEYITLWDRFGSIDPYRKLTYDYWKYLADIEKAAQENRYVEENRLQLQEAAWNTYLEKVGLVQKEVAHQVSEWEREMHGFDMSPLQKIDYTFENIATKIMENKKLVGELGEELKKSLLGKMDSLKQKAKELEYTKQLFELEKDRLEIVEKYSNLLSLSVSFSDKRLAASLRLDSEYKKWYMDQQIRLNELQKKFGNDENMKQFLQDYKTNFEEMDKYARMSLMEQQKEVWEPFYKALKDMQEQWAESISQTLTDILFDASDWTTKITDLFRTISKEIVNAFIRTNIVQPFMDQINNIGGGGIFGSLFGKTGTSEKGILGFLGLGGGGTSKKSDMTLSYSMASPLPVIVTNPGELGYSQMPQFVPESSLFTKMWQGLKDFAGFSYGGSIPGYGGGDSVPAMLEPGEYVINKFSVKKLGKKFFDSINKKQEGGLIEGLGIPEFNIDEILRFMNYEVTEDDFLELLSAYQKGAVWTKDLIYEIIKSPYVSTKDMLESIGRGDRFSPTYSLLETLFNIPGGDTVLLSKFKPLLSNLVEQGKSLSPLMGILAPLPDVLKSKKYSEIYPGIVEGSFSSLYDKKTYVELSDNIAGFAEGFGDSLEDNIFHPKFFSIFRDKVKDFKYSLKELEDGIRGQISQSDKTFEISRKLFEEDVDDAFSVAIHELSHTVEISSGGNEIAAILALRNDIKAKFVEMSSEFREMVTSTPIKYGFPEKGSLSWKFKYGEYAREKLDETIPIVKLDKEADDERNKLIKEMIDASYNSMEANWKAQPENKFRTFSYYLYQNLIGETYARDAALRRELTLKERLFNLLPHPKAGFESMGGEGLSGLAPDARWSVLSTELMPLEESLEFKWSFDEWPDYDKFMKWYKEAQGKWIKPAYGFTTDLEFFNTSFKNLLESMSEGKSTVFESSLDIRKILDPEGLDFYSFSELFRERYLRGIEEISLRDTMNDYYYTLDLYRNLKESSSNIDFFKSDPRIKELLGNLGYTGIILKKDGEKVYSIFDSSAIRSIEEFATTLPDIFEDIKISTGGHLSGYGGGDIIPAMLEPGEYVINKDSVKQYGVDFFERLNKGEVLKRAKGGGVDLSATLSIANLGMQLVDKLFSGKGAGGILGNLFGYIFGGSKGAGGGKGMGMGSPIPVYVTNFGSMLSGGSKGAGGDINSFVGSAKDLYSGLLGDKTDIVNQTTSGLINLSKTATDTVSTFVNLQNSGSDLTNSFLNNASSLAQSFGNIGSGFFSGGGGNSILTTLFSGASESFGEGGVISEPVFGVGLNSGRNYAFGEKGQPELVSPMTSVKTKGGSVDSQSNVYVNFHINAIDSKSGTEFLLKHSPIIEGTVSKALKNNRQIRKDMFNSR